MHTLSDPIPKPRRKAIMLTEQIVTKADETSLASSQSRVKLATIKARASRGASRLANSTENTRWVECLELIRASQDRKAFAQLFAHFAPRVKAFLMKQGSDPSLAEECMQEAMVAVWHKAHLFDPARASAATWIFTIARNKRIDALRKINRPDPDELDWNVSAEPEAEEVLAMQQENTRLGEALKDLPEKQREMIVKAFYGDLSHQEIADETGLPLGTIKSRIRLALERLRHNLD